MILFCPLPDIIFFILILHASTYNVPHYYLTYKLRVDKLLKLREEINRDRTEKISLNDLFIKAVAKTSRLVPESRSFWDPENNRIRVSDSVDISFAVDTGSGLITPIVKGADKKSLSAVNKTTKGLIEKAKNNKLAPAEYIGGTMSISNMGMFGVKQFTAIINPPQSCILAIASPYSELIKAPHIAAAPGSAGMYDRLTKHQKPNIVVDSYSLTKLVCSAETGAGSTVETPGEFGTFLNVTLSCDHRLIDGAVGSRWLQTLQSLVENPIKILI